MALSTRPASTKDKKRSTQPSVAIIGSRGYPSFYGGFETAVRRVAPALAEDGWRVVVYSRRGAVSDNTVNDPRVETVFTPGIDQKSLSTLSFGLTSVLHAAFRRPQVALVMNVANGFWLPILRLAGVRTVVNVDGIEWERAKWSRLGKAVFRWGARLTARYADVLVVDSTAIGDRWLSQFGRSGEFIPYGASADDVETKEPDLPPGRFVLMVARLVPENSVAEFLDAIPEIISTFDVDVVVVGSAAVGDPLGEQLDELAASTPRVHALGHISDDARLFGLWEAAGAYFHGHTVGGTNPALVQAMALGSKVAARDTVFNREVLSDVGLYCSGDTASIVEAIGQALGAPDELRKRARERAESVYSWESVCRRYSEVLTEARRV